MTNSEMTDKVFYSFKNEFGVMTDNIKATADVITGYGEVTLNNSLTYWCRLTSKGVKKNSWRREV